MHQTESQKEVFALLSDPATYGADSVSRIDTHAAAVFLAGDRAYKVKRAVRFPFLDYSTVDKRRAACEAELEVNKPFAPDIYRRVVAVTRENGELALDGKGEPADWAVEMRRFDENATLDHLADQNKFDAALADGLARTVAAAHGRAPIVQAEPWLEALARFIAQNDAEFGESPELFPAADASQLTLKSSESLGRVRPLLLERGKGGLVRRGHGDLHLGNIALIDGRPIPFDAIEFDPVIAAGDVFYDLAFLLMDLVERGLKLAANVVLNRYLAETRRAEDLDALAALPLFMSMRAAIRAKVTAARPAGAAPDTREAIEKAATAYFRLACALIAPPAPTLVAVGGLSGTGKSVLARALAAELMPAPGAVLLRSDVERKAQFGAGETDRLPPEAYAQQATEKVYAALADKALRVARAGHSAIADAVFASAKERAAIEAVAMASGLRFQGLFLVADLATRTARAESRSGDASDAKAEIARQQEAYDLGAIGWHIIDASSSPGVTLERARAALSK